jgi:hypothetical protein
MVSALDCSLSNVLCVAKSGGEYSTLQAAINAAKAGDTVQVADGSYGESISIAKSGTAASPITVSAQNKRGATVKCISIDGSYIILDGLRSESCSSTAITVDGSNNRVLNNYAYQPQMGITVGGTNNLIEGNEVERLRNYGSMGDCDYSRFFGDNHVFRNNFFHGTDFSEIGDAHVDCFQTFDNNGEHAKNILVEGTICYDFHQGFMGESEFYKQSTGITFQNNIFAHGGAWGLCVQEIAGINAIQAARLSLPTQSSSRQGNSHLSLTQHRLQSMEML